MVNFRRIVYTKCETSVFSLHPIQRYGERHELPQRDPGRSSDHKRSLVHIKRKKTRMVGRGSEGVEGWEWGAQHTIMKNTYIC